MEIESMLSGLTDAEICEAMPGVYDFEFGHGVIAKGSKFDKLVLRYVTREDQDNWSRAHYDSANSLALEITAEASHRFKKLILTCVQRDAHLFFARVPMEGE